MIANDFYLEKSGSSSLICLRFREILRKKTRITCKEEESLSRYHFKIPRCKRVKNKNKKKFHEKIFKQKHRSKYHKYIDNSTLFGDLVPIWSRITHSMLNVDSLNRNVARKGVQSV